jgi:CheY-like chemotaxis protein
MGRAETAETAGTMSSPKLRLLVVDDEPLVAAAIRMMLDDHTVTVATGGEAALAELATGTFDAVLCDLMMPRMSGMQLYDQVKTLFPGIENRIVFMSGGVFTESVDRFLRRVPNPCIDKPLDLDEVHNALLAVAPLIATQ